jgi:hypothetical protein
MSFDSEQRLWIGNAICVNVQHANLTFERIGGLQGLPTNNITSMASIPFGFGAGSVWFGTQQGAFRWKREPEGSPSFKHQWRYYFGPRWLPSTSTTPGQTVLSLAVSSARSQRTRKEVECAVLVTSLPGLSKICWEEWTLSEKAEYIQSVAQSARHQRDGLVDGPVRLNKFGTVQDGVKQQAGESSGLWTAIYLMSQSYRYAATRSAEAKQKAWRSFAAMEFLNTVTGIPGLMARTVAHHKNASAPLPGPWWHVSKAYPGWAWMGDTSSDEVAGHMAVRSLWRINFAETRKETDLIPPVLPNNVRPGCRLGIGEKASLNINIQHCRLYPT